ncbi:NAD(P)H-dependent oxidoreductase [Hyphomicrobium sp.]|uniref:NAD(P)H-dependent oxidoreductase n=1 Tax=Hyphomicrobium sp. TaxID=82 RepID=UPI003F6EA0EF
MVNIDAALAGLHRDGRPIQVAMVGAGTTGRMISVQLLTPVPGIRLAAIANRSIDRAVLAYSNAGVEEVSRADDVGQVERCIERGAYCVVDDPALLCAAGNIDVIIEVTGAVEHGASVALDAIRHGKHIILVNAEVDSTVGPILAEYARKAGVVMTNTDGDEPGVAMTLIRYLKSIGLRPVAAGNMKGMIDHYRTPETQREFAEKYGQSAPKVTSFADGTKLAMECAVLANASGFGVGQRGMYGPKCAHVSEMVGKLPADQLLSGGLVDYALGAAPYTGAFVLVHEDNPKKQKELAYFKLGDGPFYAFYVPYHLPHIQIASTIAHAVLYNDATVAPLGAPLCEVAAVAKRDLKAGQIIDEIGGYTTYGVIENAKAFTSEDLLPMGVAEGCRVLRDLPKDTAIGYADVALPEGRLCDQLRAEQARHFGAGDSSRAPFKSPRDGHYGAALGA